MRAQPLKAFKIILSESKFLSVWCVHNYGVCTVHIQYTGYGILVYRWGQHYPYESRQTQP